MQVLRAGVDAPNCHEHTLMASRCAASCDETQARCTCGPRSRYPTRHVHKCEFAELKQMTPWKRAGWDGSTIVRPWRLWAAANTTPPWFEAALGRGQLERIWREADSLPKETRELAWCDRPPGPAARRRARRAEMPNCGCYENRAGTTCEEPVRSCERRAV